VDLAAELALGCQIQQHPQAEQELLDKEMMAGTATTLTQTMLVAAAAGKAL
jgi:hypothetical protein